LLALSFLPSMTSKGLAETDGVTTIDFPGASFTSAQGINRRDDIVGACVSAGVVHGFLLSDEEQDKDATLCPLARSIDMGFVALSAIEHDRYLMPLRQSDLYRSLVDYARMRQRAAAESFPNADGSC